MLLHAPLLVSVSLCLLFFGQTCKARVCIQWMSSLDLHPPIVFAQDEQQENQVISADLDITAQFPDNPFGCKLKGYLEDKDPLCLTLCYYV